MKKNFSFREVLWHSPERAFEANGRATILYNVCEKHHFKITATFPGGGGGAMSWLFLFSITFDLIWHQLL